MNKLSFFVAIGVFALLLAGCTYKVDMEQTGTPVSDQANDLLTGVLEKATGSQDAVELSQTFTSEQDGVSMRYPAGWKAHTNIQGVIAGFTAPRGESDSDSLANVILEADDLSANPMSAAELDQRILVQAATAYGGEIKILNYTDTLLDGNEGKKVVFTGEVDGRQYVAMQQWAMVDDKAYIVTYTAEKDKFGKYLAEAEAMAGSVKLDASSQAAATAQEPPETSIVGNEAQSQADESLFIGDWRIFSSVLYYYTGGASMLNATASTSTQLVLNAAGTWEFGDSSGTWAISDVTDADWEQWLTEPYGPTRKITLENWAGRTVSGPIEESHERVDFFWLIYNVAPPEVESAGQVQYKFGHGYE